MAIAPQQDTKQDYQRLRTLEATVEKGLTTFVKVGLALHEIRESRLYRMTHKDFAGYCDDRFNLSSRRVNQLIEGAKVAEDLGNRFPIPKDSSVASAIAKVNQDERDQVWEAALEKSPEPTAADVREVVESCKPKQDRASQRQSIKDSESAEMSRRAEWVVEFNTFQNQLAALKDLFASLDPQVMGLVRHLVEVVDDG